MTLSTALFPITRKALQKLSTLWLALLTITAINYSSEVFAAASTTDEPNYETLLQSYQKIKPRLAHNKYNAPVDIRSDIEDNRATGHVYAVLQHPFTDVSNMLQSASDWCDATMLHINIKMCINNNAQHKPQSNATPTITLFVGQKEYQTPAQSYRIDYHYRATTKTARFIQVELTAPTGPMDSKDYRISVEVIPIDDHSSFMHFSYSARYALFSRLMLDTYLATLGRNKVGFTKTGIENDGKPIYIKGLQGIIERNSMRYFLAINAYLDTASLPTNKRYIASLNEWYDFSLKYKRQLYELDRAQYLDIKRREHANRLQYVRNGTLALKESDEDF